MLKKFVRPYNFMFSSMKQDKEEKQFFLLTYEFIEDMYYKRSYNFNFYSFIDKRF